MLKKKRPADPCGTQGGDQEGDGTKAVVDLLVSQVQFANVIVINKTVSQKEPCARASLSRSRCQKKSAEICAPQDLVEKEVLGQIHGVLMTLNPDAKIYQTQR